MAIPHISVQLISRSSGRSAVAAAAYRAAEKLSDLRLGKTADFSRKQGVVHTEILAPRHAAPWMRSRASLWNGVEAAERRKDAQVAREVQVALPRDLSFDEQLKLLRAFVHTHFVDAGMVADFAVHLDNPNNPHAHIMLTTRSIEGLGTNAAFGPKARGWNAKDKLLSWREGWAVAVNRALERNGIEQRIDHRSYGAQGIALEPTPKIGVGEAHGGRDGRDCIADRLAEHDATVRRNGAAILAEPAIALIGITQQRATFTRSDMGRYLHTYTADAAQFQACLSAVMASPELVRLEVETPGDAERFTTREMLEAEAALLETGRRLAARTDGHAGMVDAYYWSHAGFAVETKQAVRHVLMDTADIAIVEGYAGAGKSRMLGLAREAWTGAGYRVLGGALSGKAAEGLEIAASIPSRSLASWEHQWGKGRESLSSRDIFVIDEAGMVGTRQMQRVLAMVEAAGAKAVLVGDTQQLQAIEAGAPMRALADAVGHFAMVNIQRQRGEADRRASVQLAQGRTAEALVHYTSLGAVRAHADQGAVVTAMVGAWDADRQAHPNDSQMMLAYRKADVTALNEAARALRSAAGRLGAPHVVQTARGQRVFATGDRVYFLRNDTGLKVKNGTLGTLVHIRGSSLQVRLDAVDADAHDVGRQVAFDAQAYPHLDHGYAATVHKAQGVTVDRAYVLASPHFDRHTTYVALTRHREAVHLHYNREDFATSQALSARLSRAQAKDMAVDYAAHVAANARMEAERARQPERDGLKTCAQAHRPMAQGDATLKQEVLAAWRAEQACGERIKAYEALVRQAQVAESRARSIWRTDPEVLLREHPDVRAAEQARDAARDRVDALRDDAQRQDAQERTYREAHPVRAKLGTEAPRRVWQQTRALRDHNLSLGRARLVQAEARLETVHRDRGLRAQCQQTAQGERTRKLEHEREAQAARTQMQSLKAGHAADKAQVAQLQAERQARLERVRTHKQAQSRLTQAQKEARMPRITFEAALENSHHVFQSRYDVGVARTRCTQQQSVLERARDAWQRHQQAHPVQVKLSHIGLGDTRIEDAYKQAERDHRDATAEYRACVRQLEATLKNPRVCDEARRRSERECGFVDRAQALVPKLEAELKRGAETYQADKRVLEVEQSIEPNLRSLTQERSHARDMELGMER